MAKLILRFKEAVLKEYPLDKSLLSIGRAPSNDIVIDNLVVSSFHARVVSENGRFFIEDLGSTNGTFIGERRISRAPLSDQTPVTIGKHTVIFSDPEATGDADATMTMRKAPSMDATMLIEPKKAGIEQTSSATMSGGKAAPDVIGGFTVLEGRTDHTEYELTKRLTTIGKADNAEIKLKGFFAPKIAALVNRTRDGYVIGPAVGEKVPLVNGTAIDAPTRLNNLDIVEVGNLKLQFYLKE